MRTGFDATKVYRAVRIIFQKLADFLHLGKAPLAVYIGLMTGHHGPRALDLYNWF